MATPTPVNTASLPFEVKKRIRKRFGKLGPTSDAIEIPHLLETQINSYASFLQQFVPAEERVDMGLQAALQSVVPIESYSGNATLEYVKYEIGEPPFDVKECNMRGLTYA